MPKHTFPKSKFYVSFNTQGIDHNGEEVEMGESDLESFDWYGDDRDALAAEVIAADNHPLGFPMRFVANPDAEVDNIIGWFVAIEDNPEDEYCVALMLPNDRTN